MAGFCLVSLDLKEKIHKPKPWIYQVCKEIHTATLGMKLMSVVCKFEIQINLSKSKVKLHPYSQSIFTTKCVISPYSKLICTKKCGIAPLLHIDMHHLPGLEPGASACKLSVQTTTPPVLDTILIEQQAIILPRYFNPSWLSTYK